MILSTLQIRLFAISPFRHFLFIFSYSHSRLLTYAFPRSPFPLRFPSLKE